MKEKEYYKEQIIEMVQKISNASFLTIIYDFVKPIYEKEKSRD